MKAPAGSDAEGLLGVGLVPRADRFQMVLPVQYRAMSDSAAEQTWHEGLIENISGSGVLFRAAEPLAAATAIELMFSLPSSAHQPPATVRCRAQVVRAAPPQPPDTRTALAVVIQHYRLARGAAARPKNPITPE